VQESHLLEAKRRLVALEELFQEFENARKQYAKENGLKETK